MAAPVGNDGIAGEIQPLVPPPPVPRLDRAARQVALAALRGDNNGPQPMDVD